MFINNIVNYKNKICILSIFLGVPRSPAKTRMPHSPLNGVVWPLKMFFLKVWKKISDPIIRCCRRPSKSLTFQHTQNIFTFSDGFKWKIRIGRFIFWLFVVKLRLRNPKFKNWNEGWGLSLNFKFQTWFWSTYRVEINRWNFTLDIFIFLRLNKIKLQISDTK